MPYQAAIFDLDGTLVDSLRDLAETANAVLVATGFPQHPVDAYRFFVGEGAERLIRLIVPSSASDDHCRICLEMFIDRYAGNWRINSCPYPGIRDMLHGLKEIGLKMAVLSNKPHSLTQDFIEYFFPEGYFDLVFGQRPAVVRKPSPQGAIEISSLMNIPPPQCLYIGDTAIDMQTGKAAGMYTVGVLWGFRDRLELERNSADLIVGHPMEIVEHVRRSR